ncbi:MAG: apolipoprotein N-acyltransferase [Candidatus Omnitrophica bacterium]|nr:apolipoprotein N-acyltransferase [Candidatus Omnitrophota bacterium]
MPRFLLLSVFSGILGASSFLSYRLSFLIWIACIPFFWVITRADKRQLPVCAGAYAVTFFGIMLCWVAHVSRLGLVALLLYLSGYVIVFSFFARTFLPRRFSLCTVPALWVVFEFLREQLWTGFGWGILGYSQYSQILLIQGADILGTKGISFLIIMINVFLLHLFTRRKRLLFQGMTTLGIIVGAVGYSFWTMQHYPVHDTVFISIIQPNIPQELKWNPNARTFIVDRLGALARLSDHDRLLVYPEASWPDPVDEYTEDDFLKYIRSFNQDVLMGALMVQHDRFYNSAILVTDKNTHVYHKVKLVPFGEYVPLRSLVKWVDALSGLGDISPGVRPQLFKYQDKQFAVLICFEDIFPLFTLNQARHSDFLINITNDAWFKGEPEASQHLAIMTMRAIENRISIVRSANTGISGYVDFLGHRYLFEQDGRTTFFAGTGNFEVKLNSGRSLYNRWGDLPLLLLCGILITLGIPEVHKNAF